MKRNQTIKLARRHDGAETSFTLDHAERILARPNGGGWKLPEDSDKIFKDGHICKRNQGGRKGAEQKPNNK